MSFLQKKIINFNPYPFSLDLSDLSLKAILLERSGSVDRVKSFSSVNLPQGSVVDGEIHDEDAVVSAIRSLIEKSSPKKIRTRQVVCSLPEIKAFLRIIILPFMEESEVQEAIRWEIEANIPLSLDQVYYDYQILDHNFSKKTGKMSVLVVAVAKSIVDQFVSILEKAGLEVIGLETESIAQARSLLVKTDNQKTTLIVDIGDRRTSFLVSIGNIPCFTSSIPLSSQMMTDAISKSLRMPFDEAETMKLTHGIGSSSKKDALFRAVQPVLENLIVEIEKSIDFYVSGLQYSPAVESIILCGGGSNMVGLLPYLSQRFAIPIELGDPWVNINLGGRLPVIERKRSVQYSTAIGLALRNLKFYGD